jgi:hypothetical protein
VTDQGSLSIACSALSRCGSAEAELPLPTGAAFLPRWRQSEPGVRLCCRVCGRKGRFIDPFPRIPRRR